MEFNIADLFESIADVIGDRDAVVSGETRLTFAELDRRANRLAHALSARGIGPGDHIGLYLFNGHEFVEAMLAAFKLRAVPVNINYRYVADELRYLCTNADVKALLFNTSLAEQVAAIAAEVPTLRLLMRVADETTGDGALPGAVDYEAALAEGSPARDFPARSGSDLYVIYTGGTTGMPRGVLWRQEDMFFAGLQGGRPGGEPLKRPEELADVVREGASLNILPAAPFIHGAAQWACWIALFSGGKCVIAPGRSFSPRTVLELVEREKVTTITLVGDAMARPIAEALAEPGASYDTSSLFVIASAGAVLSRTVLEALKARLPDTMVLNNFGASETGHQGTVYDNPTGEGPSAPRFYMDATSTVLGDDGKPIAPGSGTIGKLARSGHVPLGYYKDPEKTAQTFVTHDGVRWVIPGDLATIESDGRITVFGRGAVCINTGGEKVFPEEVEQALKAHPEVLDAVVVGVPDPRWGERVAAIVQPRPGFRPTLTSLDPALRKQIAGYKVPRELFLVELVVRHPSGKPDYRWAKAIALGSH